MRIRFRYESLDSREQRVARLLVRLSQTFTMAGLGGQSDLAPTICTYCAYFSLPETDPFSGDYEDVLDPYQIDPINAAGVPILSEPGRHVPKEVGGRVSLLYGCVDLLRYAGQILRGSRVYRVNPIWI